ncbi:carotenoid oxygenase family protein [Sinorhizobium numidicum]|uniref:Dioxygenase n=1 Tax=Sinorhizobium numidicum TaxID=680248 RepID=A0ABY8CNX2_9HYPH|nr:carotenoid oxygenase family protein [Sinorhizobium numidicum]WEX74369.1 carotenoid oxygenase family protein [Sinorhizobium numidicum]WEX80356.1 carotenoid oxygenase family protein [Sinorhizobium numidicum]
MIPMFAKGFADLEREVAVETLPVTGAIPSWLSGALLRTGPAKFDLGRQTLNHWFDGLAMLHRFAFNDGQVAYANRFVRSANYREQRRTGRLSRGEFASDPCRTLFGRVLSKFVSKPTDNCNVSVNALGQSSVAMTETTLPVRFDPETLETLGHYKYGPEIGGQLSIAHPHHDTVRRCQFSYVVEFGRQSRYRLFRVSDEDSTPAVVAELPVDRPAYMHSFAMTERYLVLVEFPLVVSPLRLLLSGEPFIRNYRWEPQRGLRFQIVEKDSGRRIATAESDAAFAFHHVNAYERGDELVLDLVTYSDAGIIDQLYLSRLRTGEPVDAVGSLSRYVVPLDATKHSAQKHQIATTAIELPRIDYGRVAGRPYRAVWGTGNRQRGNFLDSLVRIDVETGDSSEWMEPGCYPGEPVFVAAPDGSDEEEGLLLSVVLEAQREKSFLLVLDASRMTEIARAECPHPIPFGFHGNFFPASNGRLSVRNVHR